MVAPTHLRSLQALELAVRRGSFVAAAEGLGITPAAVGQRVKALEDYLGVELLSRRGSPVALRVVSADGGSRQVSRAVEVYPIDGSGGRCFVSNAAIEAGSRVEVIHDAATHLAELGPRGTDVLGSVEVLLNAGDYFLIGERAEPAVVAEPEAAGAPA